MSYFLEACRAKMVASETAERFNRVLLRPVAYENDNV